MAANSGRLGRFRRKAFGLFWLTVCVALYGCAVPERLTAVPENATTMAEIRGIPKARFFPETQVDLLVEETREAQQREISR